MRLIDIRVTRVIKIIRVIRVSRFSRVPRIIRVIWMSGILLFNNLVIRVLGLIELLGLWVIGVIIG